MPLLRTTSEHGVRGTVDRVVCEDRGTTRVAYRPATELARSFAVAERAALLGRMDALLAEIVGEST